MLSYFNTTELYQVYEACCAIANLKLIDIVLKKDINIVIIESWNQLLESTQTDVLFTETKSLFTIYDIKELSINKLVLQKLAVESDILMFSSTSKILATDKKLISTSGGEIIEKNVISKTNLENLAIEYMSKNRYILSKTDLSTLLQLTTNFLEIIDIIDYAFLSNDPHLALRSLIKKEETPIFMLPLRVDRIKDDLRKWLPYLNNESSQLILSMFFTKLDKQQSQFSNLLQKKLIKIDNMIKSQSRIDSVLLLKVFIWKTIHENN
jgi:hypothetical protein